MALGNAVGSVIYDDGLALPMAALFATAAIAIDRIVLRSAAIFLITVDLVAWYMAFDGTLARVEGGALVGLFGPIPNIFVLGAEAATACRDRGGGPLPQPLDR